MTEPILYDSHMHTPLCKHARGKPEAYAAHAEKRGLKGIIVTCHNPIPGGYSSWARMDVEQWDEYVALIEQARQSYIGRVDIRMGLECDYYPGAEAWLEELLAKAEFHHILGSIHPNVGEYRHLYDTGSPLDYQRLYFDHLAQAAETGLFDTLSHPDLIKNLYPRQWDIRLIWKEVEAALDRIAQTGVAMELNTSGLNKEIREMNPNPTMLKAMAERNIPVIVNSDSHDPWRVGADFEQAFNLLSTAGYHDISLFLHRQRYTVPLDIAKASLKKV